MARIIVPRPPVALAVAPTVSGTGTVNGGGGPAFTTSGPFSVDFLDGDTDHGSRVRVTRSSGTFASRQYGTTPWLADFGDVAYQAGVAKTPLASYSDGDEVAVNPPNRVWDKYGQAGHEVFAAVAGGARSAPNQYTTKWLFNDVGEPDMKCEVMLPVWPSSWNGGVQNNRRVYVSFWFRAKSYPQIQNNGKFGRFCEDPCGGSNYFYPQGCNTVNGNIQETTPVPASNTWTRIEYYADLDLDVIDIYINYRYTRQEPGTTTTPGPREFRNSTPYNASTNRGGYLYTAGGNPLANIPFNITSTSILPVSTLGFDGQNSNVHVGQEFDIANFYVDPEWERPEIVDGNWDLSPDLALPITNGPAREVQMRWERESDTSILIYINRGQFTSLAGKKLVWVNDFKTAETIGTFG